MLHSKTGLNRRTETNETDGSNPGLKGVKPKMQSAKLQYIMPDESIRGQKNLGVIAQYPYFAPDQLYLKKAPKMTKADELYLRKFMGARDHKDVARIDKTGLADRQYVKEEPESDEDDEEPFEVDVNERLFIERNKGKLPPGQIISSRSASGDKVTLTSQIFGENRYFKQKEDTTEDPEMNDYVRGDWKSSAFTNKKKKNTKSVLTERKGKAGNVVPFFPSEWKKNANDVFNIIMSGGPEPTEDNFDETTHAAIYRKTQDQHNDVNPYLYERSRKTPENLTVRPTSGKHYARERQFKKKKGDLQPPNTDPVTSSLAKNYKHHKQIEGLLNRLADYMAGEIPESGDMDDLFKPKNAPDANGELDDGPEDDVTTNYTKYDPPRHKPLPKLSLEPIYGPPVYSKPHQQNSAEMEPEDSYLDTKLPLPEEELPPVPEEPAHQNEDTVEDSAYMLPDIYATASSAPRTVPRKRQPSPPKKRDTENLLIYKDFDTSLTKVKTAIRKLPFLEQTTSKRSEDLIRDRLLSFNVKNGQISSDERKVKSQLQTINERSKAILSQRRIGEQIAAMKQMNKRQARDMQHKAFWVHNSTSNQALPGVDPSRTPRATHNGPMSQRVSVSHSTPQLKGISSHLKSKHESLKMSMEVQRRVNDGKNPIPIQDNEKLTSPDRKLQGTASQKVISQGGGVAQDTSGPADMKLVQQYVLVRGRLQPALKYIAQNPMFNRYQVKNAGVNDGYQEIVTYPTVSGNLKMKNKHVGVNFDDRDIPVKALPNEAIVEDGGEKNLEGIVKKLQDKNIKYNRDYYQKVQRRNIRQIDPDEIEDPRSLRDIQQENVELKEQFIHQMVTLEQYLAVAVMWQAEKEEGYNPFETGMNFAEGDSMMRQSQQIGNDQLQQSKYPAHQHNQSAYGQVRRSVYDQNSGLGLGQEAEDGWIDYVDNVNTISQELEAEKHKEVFDVNQYNEAKNKAVRVDAEGNVLAVGDAHKTGRNGKKFKTQQQKEPFIMPGQVQSLNSKIRNIFFSQNGEFDVETGEMITPDFSQSPKSRAQIRHQGGALTTRKAQTVSTDLRHYGDHDYKSKLQLEVNQLRILLEADFKNQRIVDLENKIRNNKRIIVNLMTENIFQLRFGFDGNQRVAKRLDRDELLMRMLQSRLKRIRIVNNLIKISSERRYKLLVWGLHSDLIDYRRLVRVMGDIVILLQEKNLIYEMHGRKNFIKVGEIELKLDWPILIRSKYGPMDAKDYYSRKLRMEIDENNALVRQIERDIKTSNEINNSMKAFISAVFGNDGWIRLVEARWLRNNQRKQIAEYDPKDVVPQFVTNTYATQSIAPRTIREELPTNSSDQFGDYHSRSAFGVQQASYLLHSNLHMFNRFKPINKSKVTSTINTNKNQSLARRALKGQSSAQKIMERRSFVLENPQQPEEASGEYGLIPVVEKAEDDIKSKADSMFTANAGAMIDGSFRDEDESLVNRTVQDNLSVNSFAGRGADNDKPLTNKAASEVGNDDFAMRFGGPSASEVSSAAGERKIMKAAREEAEAKKALNRLRATIELEENQKQEQPQAKKNETASITNKAQGDGDKSQAPKAQEGEDPASAPKKSNWLEKIREQQLARDARLQKEKEEREKRLKALLDSDSEDNEENFNYKEMVGDKLTDFLSKIENHVKAEQVILDAWNVKDDQGREDRTPGAAADVASQQTKKSSKIRLEH